MPNLTLTVAAEPVDSRQWKKKYSVNVLNGSKVAIPNASRSMRVAFFMGPPYDPEADPAPRMFPTTLDGIPADQIYWPLTATHQTVFNTYVDNLVATYPETTHWVLDMEPADEDNGKREWDLYGSLANAITARQTYINWAKARAPQIQWGMYSLPYRRTQGLRNDFLLDGQDPVDWAVDERSFAPAIENADFICIEAYWWNFTGTYANWLDTLKTKLKAIAHFYNQNPIAPRDIYALVAHDIDSGPTLTEQQFQQVIEGCQAHGVNPVYWAGDSTVLADIPTGVQNILTNPEQSIATAVGSSFTINNVTTNDYREYWCELTNGSNRPIDTDRVEVSVGPSPQFVSNLPSALSLNAGDSPEFSVEAENADYFYWQTSPSGSSTWTTVADVYTSYYEPGAVDGDDDGLKIRAVAGNKFAQVTSNELTMAVNTVTSPGEITLTTTAITADEGASFALTATRSGGTDGAASVNWGLLDPSLVDESGSGAFNWADGEGGAKTVNLTAAAVTADDSTFTALSSVSGATLGSPSSGTLSVTALAPTISSISPNTGTDAGGTPITISGEHFTGATGVTVGGIAATSVTFVNDGSITCVTPAGTAGAQDVIVTTSVGSSAAGTFTYTAAGARYSVADAVADWIGGGTWGTFNTPTVPSLTDYTPIDVTPATIVASGFGATDNQHYRLAAGDYTIGGSLGARFTVNAQNVVVELADGAHLGDLVGGFSTGMVNWHFYATNPHHATADPATIRHISRGGSSAPMNNILFDGVLVSDQYTLTNEPSQNFNEMVFSGERIAWIGCWVRQDYYAWYAAASGSIAKGEILIGNSIFEKVGTASGSHPLRVEGGAKVFGVDSWFLDTSGGSSGQFRMHSQNGGSQGDLMHFLRCEVDINSNVQVRGDSSSVSQASPRLGRVRFEGMKFRRNGGAFYTAEGWTNNSDCALDYEQINCERIGGSFEGQVANGAAAPAAANSWTITGNTNTPSYTALDTDNFVWL